MRLDLVLPNEGRYMVEAMHSGPYFEAMGWQGLWLSDHLLGIPEDHLHQPDWLDILVSMAHLAAQTKTIRIASGVVVLPYRDPVLTARMVASLDQLSGGRIDFGVGVGWLRREYQALGVGDAYDDRGAYANEMLDVILSCWKGGVVEFHGKWFDVPPVTFEPVPVQNGGRVPLWIGSLGTTGAPIRRVAKYADVWHPSELTNTGARLSAQQFREVGDRIDELAGRKVPRSLRIKCDGDPRAKLDQLQGYVEAGCTQFACSFILSSPTFADFDRNATRFFKAAEGFRKA